MNILYAFDPATGASSPTGFAAFSGKKLYAVEAIVANTIAEMIYQIGKRCVYEDADYAVEVPEIYPRSPVDPNDMIKIAVVAGACIARAHLPTMYHPKQWNHGRPKKVTEERIKRLLTSEEVAMVERVRPALRNNAWDAVGIGLHHQGRLT